LITADVLGTAAAFFETTVYLANSRFKEHKLF